MSGGENMWKNEQTQSHSKESDLNPTKIGSLRVTQRVGLAGDKTSTDVYLIQIC